MRFLIKPVLWFVVLIGGLSDCSSRQPRSWQVAIDNFVYQPASLVVARGDTIVWQNSGIVPHTATADGGAWDSQSLAVGASWRYVADTSGRFGYHCVLHPNMTGTIDVQ